MPDDDPELEAIRARLRAEIVGEAQSTKTRPVALSAPVDVTAATFDGFVQEHPLVLVDLWAPWCGPCRFVSPVLEALARERQGALAVAKVNVDEEQELSMRFQVQSIPTLLLFKNGRLVDRLVGALPKPQLEAWLRRHAS